jgi:integrase
MLAEGTSYLKGSAAVFAWRQILRAAQDMMVTNGAGTDRCGPWIIERAIRDVRESIHGLPEGFSFHDLRHYLASLLIASGADVKTEQARMRHASARTTLDTYSHLWPDADESTRAAVDVVTKNRLRESSCGPTAVPDH